MTFSTEKQAGDYLTWVRREIEADRWNPPSKRAKVDVTKYGPFATDWLATRRTRRGTPLKPSTRQLYEGYLDRLILPTFEDMPLDEAADEATFESWYNKLDPKYPTRNAHVYVIARSILVTARKRKLLAVPVPTIDGAGQTKRRRRIVLLSVDELAQLVAALPERYRLMVETYAWCAARFGELAALRKRDVAFRHQCKKPSRERCVKASCRGILHVDRGVTRAFGGWHEDTPKGDEEADVDIPPHILVDLDEHIRDLGPDDLLFPARQGGFMAASSFHKVFNAAKRRIGRSDIRPHDLRHLGSMLAAAAGASPAELMARLRHKTAQAAQIYWHASRERDRELAGIMSTMASSQIVGSNQ
ncbi:tyrosine-type recombinase/integrase [Jiangella muralis]|uniref:tyrosine-type recombinase/integrase n=1 Tax=Jiangella muralis TaxID=702383 RepID=UPI00069E362E|nr:tyrosine-type recombinase/integrase [Jiangella muralis]